MTGTLQSIPLHLLIPFRAADGGQYREADRDLDELVDSIRESGLKEPLTARPHPSRSGYYEIISGHRRFLACGRVGLTEVPVVVDDVTDTDAEIAVMLGNAARLEAAPWEEGTGYSRLLAIGMSKEKVAQAFGKSVALVDARLGLLTLCAKAKELYLAKELTGAALELLAKLPDRILSPVKCPTCRVVVAEGTENCPACKAYLGAVMTFPSGNPQEVAARMLRGMTNGSVAQVVQKVKDAYGLSEVPVQTSLGFSEAQLSQAAVLAKTRLESALGDVARALEGVTAGKHAKELAEATDRQRAAVLQQLDAAEAALANIRKAVQG
jgi:ParB/RepB/Spo0J family partition protein